MNFKGEPMWKWFVVFLLIFGAFATASAFTKAV